MIAVRAQAGCPGGYPAPGAACSFRGSRSRRGPAAAPGWLRGCPATMKQFLSGPGLGSYTVRRCSSQIAVPSAAAVRATKMPASMDWKIQNRSAGW